MVKRSYVILLSDLKVAFANVAATVGHVLKHEGRIVYLTTRSLPVLMKHEPGGKKLGAKE